MGGSCASAWPLGLIVSLFFLWGAANSLNDVLIRQFSKAFALRDWEAGLVQSAFYIGYFFGGLPAAKVAHEYGYRAAVTVGLCLFSAGSLLFYPVSRGGGSYGGLLCCLYLIAFGLAFLEASANPWVKLLGDLHRPNFGSVALNVAQSFNPVGALVGVGCGRWFILDGTELPASTVEGAESNAALSEHFEIIWRSCFGGRATSPEHPKEYREHEAALVGPPYVVMGLVVGAVACAFRCTRFPDTAASSQGVGEVKDSLSWTKLCTSAGRLVRNRSFGQGVLAQFFYVAAQVSVWSFIIRFVQFKVPGTDEKAAADFISISLCIFILGRFVASALMCVIQDCVLLRAYAVLAFGCCGIAARAGGRLGVAAVCATSFFMSMMFPTIFSLSISSIDDEDREVGASVVVMAIVGGAIAPPIMGAISDASSIAAAYWVPAACFIFVAAYAHCTHRQPVVGADDADHDDADADQEPGDVLCPIVLGHRSGQNEDEDAD